MATENCDEELRARLERLEAELRRWRRGGLALAGLGVLTLVGAMAAPPVQELKAKVLRIVDDSGKDRIVLSSNPDEADITLLDPAGKGRLTLDIAKDRRPTLQFSDESHEETNRIVLGLEDSGHPALLLYDGDGRKRLTIGLPKDGGPVIRVLDERERLRMRFP